MNSEWMDLSGDLPVIHHHTGAEWVRRKIKEVKFYRGSKMRGASLVVSRVWFQKCKLCKLLFVAKFPFQKFCSEEHNNAFHSHKYLAEKAGIRRCRVCKKEYVKTFGTRASKVCSQACRLAFGRTLGAARDAIKRAIEKNILIDAIDPQVVFRIQKWRCQICFKTCDSNAQQFEDNRAELDHIKPLKKGGDHTWDNVQTLCHPCNSAKRDRFDQSQDRDIRQDAESDLR